MEKNQLAFDFILTSAPSKGVSGGLVKKSRTLKKKNATKKVAAKIKKKASAIVKKKVHEARDPKLKRVRSKKAKLDVKSAPVEALVRPPWPKHLVVHTDGASRGNPGPSSIGIVFFHADGSIHFETGEVLGNQTNNFAEYTALLRALELAVENGVENLTVRADSEFMIKQMRGEYKVKAPGIIPLFSKCKQLVQKIPKISFEHVRRENNKKADEMANRALDGLL